MENITNEEYRKRDGVSSSILKKLLISDAHLFHVLKNGWKKTDATILGDAVHAYLLEPNRFNDMYTKEYEVYKRATGEFKAGDNKLDDEGNPICQYTGSDPELTIKGEQYKKFESMIEAVVNCEYVMDMLDKRENVEGSFFCSYKGLLLKVRCDFMYRDEKGRLWIVDLKTVGGTKDKPSDVKSFANAMFENGYDLQAYMYTEVIKQEIPEVYGFKFVCIDAKVPSGVVTYDIVPGQSEWYELGGYRFRDAINRYKRYISSGDKKSTYNVVSGATLTLSYFAADALMQYRERGE